MRLRSSLSMFSRQARCQCMSIRYATTSAVSASESNARPPPPPPPPPKAPNAAPTKKKIKTYPPPPSVAARAKHPVDHINNLHLAELDPTGERTQLFSKTNPDAARVGDILLVRQRNGEKFAGVCLNIRRRSVDTAILLRNELLRTSVEMWFKIYSPQVEAIEVVQRRLKRARRARLYYMRKPKHDIGSVENIVRQYLRQQATLNMANDVRGRDANSQKASK